MEKCSACVNFHPNEAGPASGDCVQRVVDPRQAYYKSRPVAADNSPNCPDFRSKKTASV